MVFNPDKFQLAKEELQYAGYMVGNVNIRPTDSYLQAIRDFPAPQNISDMRSWYGLINQVADSFCKTPVSEPFRKLLKPATPYIWTDELDKAFQDSKLKIISLVKEGVKLFVVDRHTCLSKDYSKSGIGWILQQKNCKCAKITPRCCDEGWDLILAGGHFNIPAETRYFLTEGEALAIAVALESSRYYTLGCPKLMVAADHKPLLGILSDRAFDSIDNPCLIRIKQKTLPWNFDLVYVPGKQHVAADGFSRRSQNAVFHILAEIASHGVRYKIQLLVQQATVDNHRTYKPINEATVVNINAAPAVITWEMLKHDTAKDDVLTKVMKQVEKGFPDSRHQVHKDVQLYHNYRHQLSTTEGVLCYKNRVVIPTEPVSHQMLQSFFIRSC